tara:strand:+ start:262 stop:438 length:177 start_codon:yes stop_codon:yes gene_type:complete
MPHNYDVKPFDEQNTEDAAGKKKKPNIKTHDNFGYGDMPADFRKRFKEMLDSHKKNGK